MASEALAATRVTDCGGEATAPNTADQKRAAPITADQKRAQFINLVEQAAIATERAAKKVKIADNMAKDIWDNHSDFPGAQDTACFMQDLTEQSAKTWFMALEGKTAFQKFAEVVETRKKHQRESNYYKRHVVAMMGVDVMGMDM